ncbi:MAG: alpha/beta fold hydrolase [Crocinitomicaceae bacterium]
MNKLNQVLALKDGRNLGFAEYGDDEGFPIIYCHGSQSSRLEMHYDMSFASKNGLRVITVDRPGHGLSDFNANGSILGFANDVKALTDHLKIDKFSVVGMSAGAPFALGVAHVFPNNIIKAAIISGFAPYNSESKHYLSKEVKVMLSLAKSFPFLLRIMLKIQSRQLKSNPQKALNGFLKMMSAPDQEILKNESVKQIIERMFKEAFRKGSDGVAYEISKLLVQDWGFQLKDISVPVSFWQGKKDNNVPYQWAELMSSEITNSSNKMFPDEGHLIIFNHAKDMFTSLK